VYDLPQNLPSSYFDTAAFLTIFCKTPADLADAARFELRMYCLPQNPKEFFRKPFGVYHFGMRCKRAPAWCLPKTGIVTNLICIISFF